MVLIYKLVYGGFNSRCRDVGAIVTEATKSTIEKTLKGLRFLYSLMSYN